MATVIKVDDKASFQREGLDSHRPRHRPTSTFASRFVWGVAPETSTQTDSELGLSRFSTDAVS